MEHWSTSLTYDSTRHHPSSVPTGKSWFAPAVAHFSVRRWWSGESAAKSRSDGTSREPPRATRWRRAMKISRRPPLPGTAARDHCNHFLGRRSGNRSLLRAGFVLSLSLSCRDRHRVALLCRAGWPSGRTFVFIFDGFLVISLDWWRCVLAHLLGVMRVISLSAPRN